MKQLNSVTMKQSSHNLWHHLGMVIYSEVINFLWLVTAIVMAIGGVVILKFTQEAFFRLAVGLPLMLMGVSIGLFKIHEIILVVARPKRLKAICIFCVRALSKSDEEGK